MELRQITPNYAVSPQIEPADMAKLAEAGIAHVICNRPDEENPPERASDVMERAAQAAGLGFTYLALTHQTMTPERIAAQASLIADAQGPVLAYCASGTRSTVIWAIGQAQTQPIDEILAAARAAGYDLEGLRPTLAAAIQSG